MIPLLVDLCSRSFSSCMTLHSFSICLRSCESKAFQLFLIKLFFLLFSAILYSIELAAKSFSRFFIFYIIIQLLEHVRPTALNSPLSTLLQMLQGYPSQQTGLQTDQSALHVCLLPNAHLNFRHLLNSLDGLYHQLNALAAWACPRLGHSLLLLLYRKAPVSSVSESLLFLPTEFRLQNNLR